MVGPRSGIGSLDGFKNTIKKLPEKSKPPQKFRGNMLSESSGIAGSSLVQPSYTASAVHFDGLTSLRTDSLVSTDNGYFSFSFWAKADWPAGFAVVFITDPNVYNGPLFIGRQQYFEITLANGADFLLTYQS